MIIEYIFVITGKVDSESVNYMYKLLEVFRDIVRYEIISVTIMSNWFIVLVNFPDFYKITTEVERIIDSFAGAIVYALDANVRYRHYEIHGRTASLIYHKDWRRNKIALNTIVRDEAPYLKDFIEHIKDWVDDIVIVIDPRTVDSSAEIAMKLGARVFYGTWENSFSKLRNLALQQTDPTCEWVLKLDVDERISPEFLISMRDLVDTDEYDGFELLVNNIVTKDSLYQLRLFRRKLGYWEGRVHEVVRGINRVKRVDFRIDHYQRWIAEGKLERNDEYRYLEELEKFNNMK